MCALYGRSKLDTEGALAESSGNESDEQENSNLKIKSEPIDGDATAGPSSTNNDDSVTLDLLKSFSKKEKKLLLKRLIHLERKKSSK